MILPIVFWTLIAAAIALYAWIFLAVYFAPIRDILKDSERKYGKWPL